MTDQPTAPKNKLTILSYGWLLIILTVAAASRFYGLDRLSLWADEIWVVMNSTTGSLWDLASYVYYHDNHPPGYYWVSRFTQLFIGSSDFAIRLPSAVAGISLVFVIFSVVRKHISVSAALIASAMAAGSYKLIYFSQEARANIFFTLFSVIAFRYFYELLVCEAKSKSYFAFWFAAVVCAYLHYAGLVFIGCLFLVYLMWWLMLKNQAHDPLSTQQAFFLGVKIFLVPVLLYLPWVRAVYHHMADSPPEAWQHTPNLDTLIKTFAYLFGPDSAREWVSGLVIFSSVIWLTIMWQHNKTRPRTTADNDRIIFVVFALAMIALPIFVFFIKSYLSQSAYNHRHFLYAVPLVMILAGVWLSAAIESLPLRFHSYILSIVVAFILVYQYWANNNNVLYTGNHFKEDYRGAAAQVAGDTLFAQDTKNFIISSSYFFDHYLNRFIHRRSNVVFDANSNPEDIIKLLNQQAIGEFYYLEAPLVAPAVNNMITPQDQLLAEHYQPVCRTRLVRAQVIKFRMKLPVAKINWADYQPCLF